MEVICSSETSVDFQRTTRLYIPEDDNLAIIAARTWNHKYILVKLSFCFIFLNMNRLKRNSVSKFSDFPRQGRCSQILKPVRESITKCDLLCASEQRAVSVASSHGRDGAQTEQSCAGCRKHEVSGYQGPSLPVLGTPRDSSITAGDDFQLFGIIYYYTLKMEAENLFETSIIVR
jgi:hypothetical protein